MYAGRIRNGFTPASRRTVFFEIRESVRFKIYKRFHFNRITREARLECCLHS